MADISEYIAQIRNTSNGGANIRRPIHDALNSMNENGVKTAIKLGGKTSDEWVLKSEYEETVNYDDFPTEDSQKALYNKGTYIWANELDMYFNNICIDNTED